MTVFVAGVHGVGKSYLCKKYASASLVVHESASGLIRKERSKENWSADKKVAEIDDNQAALNAAVRRILSDEKFLLLDGHFVLVNDNSEFVALDYSVFQGLAISGVVLIEANASIVASRMSKRDSLKRSIDIDLFLKAEREQAERVCKELCVPLHVLRQPDLEVFSRVVAGLFEVESNRQ
ncbi:ATP-binding protein [Pseudomonas sp. QL9]|uniref:ATP-binding protein n=1 Tax=Pseudomonas sp. QL9 TaxID=3242725 RepID=UPI00352A8498